VSRQDDGGLTTKTGRLMLAGAEHAREERHEQAQDDAATPPPRSTGSALRDRVAVNLRALRKAQGLTRVGLSVRSGIQAGLIGAIEVGGANITIGQLARLAEALGVEVVALLQRPD